MSATGYKRAIAGPEPGPHRLSDDELWVQWETTYALRVMPWFTDERDPTYLDQFQGIPPAKWS